MVHRLVMCLLLSRCCITPRQHRSAEHASYIACSRRGEDGGPASPPPRFLPPRLNHDWCPSRRRRGHIAAVPVDHGESFEEMGSTGGTATVCHVPRLPQRDLGPGRVPRREVCGVNRGSEQMEARPAARGSDRPGSA
jgi:hypothetical protein